MLTHCENNNDPINITFNMIGAAAAAANLLYELSMAPKKEAKHTKNRKGKVILLNLLRVSIYQDLCKTQGLLKKLIAA